MKLARARARRLRQVRTLSSRRRRPRPSLLVDREGRGHPSLPPVRTFRAVDLETVWTKLVRSAPESEAIIRGLKPAVRASVVRQPWRKDEETSLRTMTGLAAALAMLGLSGGRRQRLNQPRPECMQEVSIADVLDILNPISRTRACVIIMKMCDYEWTYYY